MPACTRRGPKGGERISLGSVTRALARCQHHQPGALFQLIQACNQLLPGCDGGLAFLIFKPQVWLVIGERPMTDQVENIVEFLAELLDQVVQGGTTVVCRLLVVAPVEEG